MEFDPFAPESIGQPAQVAETKPSFGQTVRSNVGNFAKRAGAVLGFAGSMVAFDQANAQEVAVVTPQGKPPIAGLAVPGNPETTTEEAPTAEMIIAILKENVGDIKRKFPTCTDEALAKMAGEIALGTIDTKRLITLGTAFPEGSPQQKAIFAYSREANKPKPAPSLASPLDEKKLPPIIETKAQKDARKERERQENLLKDTLATLNKGGFFKKEAWSSNDGKGAKANTKHTRESITVEFDPKTVKKGVLVSAAKSTASIKVTLLPGKPYKWTLGQISDKAIIQLKENQKGKFNTLASSMTTGANIFRIPDGHDGTVELEVINTAMVPTTKIEKATLELITDDEAKIAGL